VLHHCPRNNRHCRTRATAHPSLDDPSTFERNTVFALILMLGIVSAIGIVSSFVVAGRDGYRRQPKETFALTV
jgi:hypothetical protein